MGNTFPDNGIHIPCSLEGSQALESQQQRAFPGQMWGIFVPFSNFSLYLVTVLPETGWVKTAHTTNHSCRTGRASRFRGLFDR
jgi:hypothetical protein